MNTELDGLINFTLSFSGGDSERHQIDFYDVSQALIGFQRSIALTTHLVFTGKIITQAPALKGARILVLPPSEGSWKITATVIAGLYAAGTAPSDSPLGHIMFSAYDYLLSESLGVHVNYSKTIEQLVEGHNQKHADDPLNLEQHKLDALVEKCSTAITEIHRPIFKTKTATHANIAARLPTEEFHQVGPSFSMDTFDYIKEEFVAEDSEIFHGRITSYNSNTYKGRVYIAREGRPIAFELAIACRTKQIIELITASLHANAIKDYDSKWSTIYFVAFQKSSRNGHLKGLNITYLSHEKLSEDTY